MCLFCAYGQNTAWERDARILREVTSDGCQIERESNQYVEQGIRLWDRGQRKRALELYHAALALTNKVLPSFAELFGGENVLVNMNTLADGYYEMGEYEFALYSYKFLLFRTYDDGFDQAAY